MIYILGGLSLAWSGVLWCLLRVAAQADSRMERMDK